MDAAADLASLCRPGMVLRTRDRREARIDRVAPAEGLIHGEVRMHGACVWRAERRYRDAPFGAPGPLDLMMPAPDATRAADQPRSSIREALEGESRHFCCD